MGPQTVLEIYRITLLSNPIITANVLRIVLEIYRITLLSNVVYGKDEKEMRFRDLQNYTTLKQVTTFQHEYACFRDLQNYTTLKLTFQGIDYIGCFRDLQNYTTLKQYSFANSL